MARQVITSISMIFLIGDSLDLRAANQPKPTMANKSAPIDTQKATLVGKEKYGTKGIHPAKIYATNMTPEAKNDFPNGTSFLA